MRAIGHALGIHGYSAQSIRVTRGGDAVSGEVYGEFFKPYEDKWVMVEIGQSVMQLPCARPDRVFIRATWRKGRAGGFIEGPNNWINPNLTSNEVALNLLQMSGQ
jgi:hypothetical protein